MNVISLIGDVVKLLGQLPQGTLDHVAEFVRALVNKDEDAAKRAATSAATSAIWAAPVKR